ncbi:PREDICTED: LOW QUALITY PROTEIN: uncharacterized protein LOC107187519 [Dufourea novaeangliae]|uniref:LOW QUALITY PROTEIN: uncharacterized protein LOC107187519 n=1 Tax=Dufourea novaeangliae TaxID=178035 RepID=UPI000767BD29|nr:PREDICTED: LOW QUALITY PROTEIN: uncharacterized protein LOC107187519 [Dufourea novaeangliae]
MLGEATMIERDLGDPSDYSLQLNRWYLKPIGAWPTLPSTSRLERIVAIVLILLCYCSISFTVVPCMLHILLEDEDIRMKLRAAGPLSHWFAGGINYTTLLMRSNEIRHCVEHLQTDWRLVTRVKDRQVMLKNAKNGRYVAVCCAAFMQAGVLSYCAVTAWSTRIVENGNRTGIVHVLPCAFQTSVVGIFSLAAVFTAHACGQLNVLMAWITELVNESRGRNARIYLNEIGVVVEHHLRVLSFISRIEDVMTRICFLELVRCSFGICMLGYYILTEWSDHNFQNLTTYFMIMGSMTFNVFIVCYIGELLTEQCKKVGEVIYMTEWYCLPHKCVLDLTMIIARSSLLIKITAAKMIHMSVSTFGDVMKTTFAYLNLLHQMV